MLWEYKVSNQIKEFELRHNPVIVTVNEFTEESAKEFRNKIALAHNTGQKVIPVVVDSYGGESYSVLSMISAIQNSKLPVATIVIGKAMSCGAILASFGTDGYRFVDKNSTVMIHDVSGGRSGKTDDLLAYAQNSKELNDKIYKMMALKCGKHEMYFLDIVDQKNHADWFLTADECIEHGLADYKRIPSMSVSIDVNIQFN